MTSVVLTAPDEGPPVVGPPVDTGVWQWTRHLLIMPDGTQWEVSAPRTGAFLTREGITGMDDPQWDLFTSDSPILHGSRFHGYRAPEREVVLQIYLYHDDGSAAWTERYRAFKAWMSPRHVIRWRVEHPESGEGRTLHMRYVDSGNPTATLDHRQRGWKHLSLHFVADERPFWEGDAISRSWRQAEPVDFFDPDGSPPFHVSQSALLGDATVYNPSDEPVWPVWTADDGDFDSVTVGVDGRVVQAPIEVRQPQPVDVAVNGDGSVTDGRSVVGENLARNPRGRNNERQTLVQNLVTNPRGRTTDGTVTVAENLMPNPRGRTTSGTVVVVADYDGDASPHPDFELVDGDLVAPGVPGWSAQNGVLYYSVTEDAMALHVSDGTGNIFVSGSLSNAPQAPHLLTEVWSDNQNFDARAYFIGQPTAGSQVTITGGRGVVRNVGEVSAGTLVVLNLQRNGKIAPGDTVYFRALVASEYPEAYGDPDHESWNSDPDFTPEWDGDPHASASRLVAPAPVGWFGNGAYWSEAHDAVFIPADTWTGPIIIDLDYLDSRTGTLSVFDVLTGDVSQLLVDPFDEINIPPADHDRYVRVMVTPGAYDGQYVDGDSTPEPETVVEWDDAPHESASRITALVPDEWGDGVRYGEVGDAVFIPAGVAAYPATEPADGGTLVVRDLTAGTITRQPINGEARLPASDRGRYVRVMATSTPLFRGPYLDEHTWDGDPDLTLEWAGDEGGSGFQLTAPCPQDWDGEGVYYSETRQAVFVPAGVEVAVQADGIGELVIDSSQGSYRAPFEGVIPSATTDRYLSFAVMQPTGEPVSLVLDARPGPRGKSAYVHSGDEAVRRTGDLTRREWAPIPPGESVPVSLDMVGNGRVTVTITPLFSEAY